MVEAAVGRKELFVGQIGDVRRVAAGLHAVGRIREDHPVQIAVDHPVHRGERALHLAVDHAHAAERTVLRKLVVPALLAEDVRVVINGREEHRVQIDAHQVVEVPVVPAGNRVHRLVGEGDRVEEGVQRALQQLHEGVLDRVAVRAAENGMLDDVEDAGIILRDGLKGDAKSLVGVRAIQPDEVRPGPVMPELIEGADGIRERGGARHREAAELLVKRRLLIVQCFLVVHTVLLLS